MATNSRITRRMERKSKRIMIIAIIGIFLILGAAVKYGDRAMIGISLLLGNKNASQEAQQNASPTFLSAPIINPLAYSATNSAQITVTGLATAHTTIDLYVNNSIASSKDAKDDGSFTFNNVVLSNGDNEVKAQAKSGKKISNFSEKIVVSYKNSPVTLTVDSPNDGDSFSKDQDTITITGKTDPDAKVTVNDFWAIVDNNGGFTYNLKLHNDDNDIKVVATDAAGNKQTQEMHVHYSSN